MLFISIDEWQSKVDWKFAVSLIEQPHWAVEHTNPWWSNAFFFCLLVSSFLQMWMSQWHTQHIIYLNRRTKINSKLEVVSLDPYLDYRFRIRVENQYGVSNPSPHNSTSRDKLHLEPIARQHFLESGAKKERKRRDKRKKKQLDQLCTTPASGIYYIPNPPMSVAQYCRLPGTERILKQANQHSSAAPVPGKSRSRSDLHSKNVSWLKKPIYISNEPTKFQPKYVE
jgi:hypothetical protein